MKKSISVALAIIMLISSVFCTGINALAETTTAITIDNSYDFHLPDEKSATLLFTPEENGYYKIECDWSQTDITYIRVSAKNEKGYYLGNDATLYNQNIYPQLDGEYVYNLTAGQQYTFSVTLHGPTQAITKESIAKFYIRKHSEHDIKVMYSAPTCIATGYRYEVCKTTGCKYQTERETLDKVDEHQYSYGICDLCHKREDGYSDYKIKPIELDGSTTTYIEQGEYALFTFVPSKDDFYEYTTSISPSSANYTFLDNGESVTMVTNPIKLEAGKEYTFLCRAKLAGDITFGLTKHIHEFRRVSTKTATCIEDGYINYYCDRCHTQKRDIFPATPNDHKFVNGVCLNCGKEDENYHYVIEEMELDKEYSFSAPVTGELFSYKYTVTKNGQYDLVFSQNAGQLNKQTIYIENGRTISDKTGFFVQSTTLELEAGEVLRIDATTKANYEYTVRISEHKHTYKGTVVPPTCNTNGYTLHYCSSEECDEEYTDNYIAATGMHRFIKEVVKPTCIDFGYTMYACDDCGIGYMYDYVEANPSAHNYFYGICEDCGARKSTISETEIALDTQLNVRITSYGSVYVTFTPESSGYYTFKSMATNGKDTYAELYDSSMNYIDENDDISSSNFNFKLTAKLTAGEKYYLLVGSYEDTTITVPIIVNTHTHSYSSKVKSATCGEKGYRRYECACGDCYYDTIEPATNKHKWSVTMIVEPNCTDNGYTLYECEVCEQTKQDNIVERNGKHSYDAGYCMFCEQKQEATSEIYYDVSIGTTSISFTSKSQEAVLKFVPEHDGYYLFYTTGYCDTLGALCDKYDDSILEDDDSGLANNCQITSYLAGGQTYYFRIRLLDFDTETIKAIIEEHNHEFVELTIPPTCSEEGLTHYTCKSCYYEYESCYVPATYEHSYNGGVCDCGEVDPSLDIPVLNDNGEAVVNGEGLLVLTPTTSCEYTIRSNGKYDVSAILFNEFYNDIETADANNDSDFNFVITKKLSAGIKYYLVVTSTTDKDISISSTVSHKYESKVVTPTCTEQGYTEQVCTVCGESNKTNFTAKTPHEFTNKIAKPTCTQQGYTDQECKKCHLKQRVNYTNATGHSYGAYKTIKPATYSATGSKQATCSKCKYVNTVTIAKKTVATPSGFSLSAKSKGFKASWKKNSNATGYEIQYATSSSFSSPKKATIKKNSTLTKTVSSLKSKKKYYVRVRAYKSVDGKKYYSKWSSTKSVTTKK